MTIQGKILALALPALVYTGCAAKAAPAMAREIAQFQSDSQRTAYAGTGNGPFNEADNTGETVPYNQTAAERKLVYRADLRIRVENPEETGAAVTVLMEQCGGYASQTRVGETTRSYVIRIPQGAYREFLAALEGLGRIQYRSENAEDVSLRYYDLEGRLATRRELLKTFQAYLEKAKNIEEILAVEERIADLQNEIDRTGKDLRNLANLVDFATVSLEIDGPVSPASFHRPTLGDRIGELLGGFGDFVYTILVVLAGIVIYGIPLLLLLSLFFWILFGRVGLVKRLWRVLRGKTGDR